LKCLEEHVGTGYRQCGTDCLKVSETERRRAPVDCGVVNDLALKRTSKSLPLRWEPTTVRAHHPH
jgi:hypothetical protein